jgi:drug/metabolite transporter (DMT)-like permease
VSQQSNLPRGILWMLGAVCCFIGMALSARALLRHMDALEIVFLRTLVMLAIVIPTAARAGLAAVRTERLPVHLLRNLLHVVGQCGWTYSLGVLTLATVFAIEFTMPV